MIAKTPQPPYYAVIFSSVKNDDDTDYAEMAEKMVKLAKQQPGFLGMESARNELGITISYWKDLESIKTWKQHTDHRLAQKLGKEKWYAAYKTRICRVERDYFSSSDH
jgi:heme-degrading monooxygenase HmoA